MLEDSFNRNENRKDELIQSLKFIYKIDNETDLIEKF